MELAACNELRVVDPATLERLSVESGGLDIDVGLAVVLGYDGESVAVLEGYGRLLKQRPVCRALQSPVFQFLLNWASLITLVLSILVFTIIKVNRIYTCLVMLSCNS